MDAEGLASDGGPEWKRPAGCYHRNMATAAFSIAPVLTPQTVGALADNLERQQSFEKAIFLRRLRPFIEGTVHRCFAPLVRPAKKGTFANRFNRLSRDFEPFRLFVNLRLVQALGSPDFLKLYEQTLLDALDPLMQTAQAMEMRPELIMATVHDYMNIMRALFRSVGSPGLQNNEPTAEQFAQTVDWFRAATRLDYGLTSVFLVLEMAIPRPTDGDKQALLAALRRGLIEFGHTTAKVVVHEHINSAIRALETPRIRIGPPSRSVLPTENHRPRKGLLSPSRRQVEIGWIAGNDKLADVYGGQWVVIEKDELVANDPDYQKARDAAKQRGIKRPFIFFVPPKDSGGFMGI